jgi:hypothetical protein
MGLIDACRGRNATSPPITAGRKSVFKSLCSAQGFFYLLLYIEKEVTKDADGEEGTKY